jgi:hypothetical protein
MKRGPVRSAASPTRKTLRRDAGIVNRVRFPSSWLFRRSADRDADMRRNITTHGYTGLTAARSPRTRALHARRNRQRHRGRSLTRADALALKGGLVVA